MSVAFTPNGRYLVAGTSAVNTDMGQVTIWAMGSKKRVASFRALKEGIWRLSMSPDGKWLAVAGYKPTIKIWDLPKLIGRKKP